MMLLISGYGNYQPVSVLKTDILNIIYAYKLGC